MSSATFVKSVQKAQICYDFELDQQDFEKLIRAQELRLIPYEEWVGVFPVPSEARGWRGIPGVQSVDYELSHGPVISVLIDVEFATDQTLDALRALIDARVWRARRLLAPQDAMD